MNGKIHNRERFLDEVRENLNKTLDSDRPLRKFTNPLAKSKSQLFSEEQLVEEFTDQSERLGIEWFRVNKSDLAQKISDILARFDTMRVSVWNDQETRSMVKGLPDNYEILFEGDSNQVLGHAETADFGITTCDYALAESGSVVLMNSRDKARAISLLPKRYIALVPKERLIYRITDVAKEVDEMDQVPTCINFISGPSNSADIEMDLVVGVHGPMEVFYIIVD
ncbi:LutC/YkgG family protein [Alkalibacillus aidingensis]|uniref:LutC/YkgG family protein n=1 Tax=Alkalibacillus aidingensis TaxID=2747607 RepID=UPI0016604C18|nr:lactate utilization protein C [Alkalibacillus aidingensis]